MSNNPRLSRQSESSPTSRVAEQFNPWPFWAVRFWHGFSFSNWMRLLWANRFAVHWSRWAMVSIVTPTTVFNSTMNLVQKATLSRRLAKINPPGNPIFILGHWRSGTTLLHELLTLDCHYHSPTTYQCFAPGHFLITQPVIPKLLPFLLPRQRPMDNMDISWDGPQEDEFTLCVMGLPSPYRRLAFPNHDPPYLEYLNFEGVSTSELARWQAGLLEFVRRLALHDSRTLVLKSPTHTGRIRALLEIFPRARFVHISRNPYELMPSTMRLWRALDRGQALQPPTHEHLEDYVFECQRRMYSGYAEQRQLVPKGNFCEIRYDELVADPVGQMHRVYERLSLAGFEKVRPALVDYQRRKKDYRPNTHQLDDNLRARIDRECRWYQQEFGYAPEPVA